MDVGRRSMGTCGDGGVTKKECGDIGKGKNMWGGLHWGL